MRDKKKSEGASNGFDELNKTQVLLLTLFVAFVTSIASSIVTVTLLDQAPPGVTQTINRVVEKTVQVAVPGETVKTIVERVREVPVIVTEEDLIAKTVSEAIPAVFVITEVSDTLVTELASSTSVSSSAASSVSTTTSPFPSVGQKVLGMGFAISADGLLVTSKEVLLEKDTYYVVRQILRDKPKVWKARLSYKGKEGFQILEIVDLAEGEKVPYLSFTDAAPRLGKTAVAIGNNGASAAIAIGSVAAYEDGGHLGGSPVVMTSLSIGETSTGAPLLDTSGRVIGIMQSSERALSILSLIEYLETPDLETTKVDEKNE